MHFNMIQNVYRYNCNLCANENIDHFKYENT